MATSTYKENFLQYVFDPFEGYSVPKELKKEAAQEIAQYLKEAVLVYVGEQRSPVAGYGAFKDLSDEYAEKKEDEGYTPEPNLEATGDMLAALDTRAYANGEVALYIKGEEAEKADGHNKLTGRKNKALPLRRFIPDEKETFVEEILTDIRNIVETYVIDEGG
jgi:hypothetical protein